MLHSCKEAKWHKRAPQQPRVRVNQARVLSDSSVEHSLVKLHQLRMAAATSSSSGRRCSLIACFLAAVAPLSTHPCPFFALFSLPSPHHTRSSRASL